MRTPAHSHIICVRLHIATLYAYACWKDCGIHIWNENGNYVTSLQGHEGKFKNKRFIHFDDGNICAKRLQRGRTSKKKKEIYQAIKVRWESRGRPPNNVSFNPKCSILASSSKGDIH
ncbi:hypothetical protein POVWA2_060260 [Plasmodium ovale wallikeri]|uniref:Uncharacterized protein n=1 Tax=Plasmodium ovale wallikeri TaxID=864142 RepID=A0A1A9A2P4_PLAOA|nr:hypothetical protein POVWA1_060920 [Plasmodium ovale wallikeri]SBT50466.1 hypothetical protein POVWA2_060260 [Plasmodium ovale wallikeri]